MNKATAKPPRTQFFASLLATLMERNHINQVQTSATSGIAVSRVNNYLQGKYRTIRPDHLSALAKAAGRTATERGELVRAYIQDLVPEDLHGLVSLQLVGEGAKPAKRQPLPASDKGILPMTAVAALTDLKNLSVRSAKARARMQWFSELLTEVYNLPAE
jgi:transcriptional regulator with XRE-family HTH domain